ncbi:DUF4181 domain-containing protein [Bacillus salitolerans]|uniref:DUF4181 domain-containing protein n=1 Tax=Bacillus salitolerans TaxID=1437434 RepID=A0ABW4LW88_9BACI
MNITTVIVYIVIMVIFSILSEKWLRWKLKMEKRTWILYQCVNSVHKWIERFILMGFLVGIFFVDVTHHWTFSFFLVVFSVRAFFEWKYDRESKEYILTAYSVILFLVFIGVGVVFDIISF